MGAKPYPAAWPGSGPWVASSRVLYVLLCVWAAVVVPLWWWANRSFPPGWHAHELVFAIGGGALASYVPTACTSWTGRAPVHGWPVVVLAVFYAVGRGVMLLPVDALPRWAFALLLAAPLWWIAACVAREMHVAGRDDVEHLFPFSVVVFCVLAGAASAWFGSGVMTGAPSRLMPEVLVGMFALLLSGVGGRMVPAFLNAAADRIGAPTITQGRFSRLPFLLALGVAVVTTPWAAVSAWVTILAAVLLVGHMAGWPWRYVRHDGLAALTLLAYSWLPVGLFVWGVTRLVPYGVLPVDRTAASHLLTMGALTGLVVTVMARTSARRGDRRLHVRCATLIGFGVLMAAVPVRLVELDGASAVLWSLGWSCVLIGHTPHLSGPLHRPVFSARRTPVAPA